MSRETGNPIRSWTTGAGGLPPIVWRVAAGLALVFALSCAIELGLLLPTRFDLSFPEGAVVSGLKDVAEGRAPYTDWRRWPHRFAPYGPLTYYLPGWLIRALPSDLELIDYYRLGRLHSLVFLIGVWALLVGLGRRLGMRWSAATLPVAIFIFWHWMQEFALSFRPDAPQVFFALLALWLALGGRARGWRVCFAMVALMISYWFKPTSWGVTLALALWTSWELGPLRAAGLWLGFLLSGLAGALFMDARLDGALTLNMLGVAAVGWHPFKIIADWATLPALPLAVLLLAMLISVILLSDSAEDEGTGAERPWRDQLVALALVFSAGFAFVQYGKVGADQNYFFEPYALACVVAVRGVQRWMAVQERKGEKLAIAVALLLGLGVQTGQSLMSLKSDIERARIITAPLPGLSEYRDPGMLVLAYHPYLSLSLGSEPSILDGYQHMHLAHENPQLEHSVLTRVRNREFDLIMIPENADYIYSPSFFPLLREHYQRQGTLGPNVVYEPKGMRTRTGPMEVARARLR